MTKEINVDLIIADVFTNWPETVEVFIKHRMACVGCPMAAFMTLGDAIRIYKLTPESFIEELQASILGKHLSGSKTDN